MNPASIISAAREGKADLLLTHARIVNVFTGEIVHGNIAVAGGRIIAAGNGCIGDYAAEETVDLEGRFAAPGFIDAHVHIESAMISPAGFVRAVLPRGTTTVVADPHEIANVLGAEGIRYMLRASENLPASVFFTLPSCVPATDMEQAGARLEAEDLEPFMKHERMLGLAEMMNFPGVIYEDPGVLRKIGMAGNHRKPVDGHAPGLSGPALNAYLAAGIRSDHECTSIEEAAEKLAAGMFIMVREGTGAKNLEALFPLIREKTFHRMMWCTDDRHPHDLMDEGHLDHIVRKAVDLGIDPVMAVQMGTLNPARFFGIRDAGALAPGYRADVIVFSDLNAPRIEAVWTGGKLRAENGEMRGEVQGTEAETVPETMNLNPRDADFSVPAGGRRIRVIGVIPHQVMTEALEAEAALRGGFAVADPSRDLLKIAVVERYSGRARTGVGFVSGLGLQAGALASSVAHDSHNIIVAGTNDADMHRAMESVVEMGGGLTTVLDGNVLAELPLPIAGLMSDAPLPVIRKKLDALLCAARKLGTALADPFMTLSFLALPVIPALKITDQGLVDAERFKPVDLFL